MKYSSKFLLTLILLSSLLNVAGAYAAGFDLILMPGQSAATDASAVIFNPAGLARLERSQPQLMVFNVFITGDFEFESDARSTLTGSDGGNTSDSFDYSALVFYAQKISPKLGVGLGFTQPVGGAVDYNDDWKGRYIVQEADFETNAFTGSFGYLVNDSLSLGAGVWFLDAEFNQTLAINSPGFADGQATIDTDDTAFAFQLGALWTPGPATKVGVSYRSQVDLELGGTLDVKLAAGAPARTLALDTELPLPQTVIVSLFQGISKTTAITVDLGWYDYSSFESTAINTEGVAGPNIIRNWKDTWLFGLGLQHKLSQQWGLQIAGSYATSPMDDSDRLPDLPIDRQIRASAGFFYAPSKALQLSIGYTYLNLGDNSFDVTGPGGGRIVGEYDTHEAHLFNLGFIYNF